MTLEERDAGLLAAGDRVHGVASGRPWPEPMVLVGVKPNLKGRIRVDFGNGIVRTYEPGRKIWVDGATS